MNENCTVCWQEIRTSIFKGTPFCCEDCKKTVSDSSSVGIYMFVSAKEKKIIDEARIKNAPLAVAEKGVWMNV